MIKFILKGNHVSKVGNALPKKRFTRRQQWTDGAKDYHEWLDFVRAEFLAALLESKKIEFKEFRKLFVACEYGKESVAASRKPIYSGKHPARMRLMIYWNHPDVHPDPENVFGSIADALFKEDKYLAGSFEWAVDKKHPRVEIEIEVEGKKSDE